MDIAGFQLLVFVQIQFFTSMNADQINKIKTASPLDLPQILIDMELYDKQRAKDLFDEVNEKFDRESMETNVIMPVFTTITDAILDLKCFRGMTKKLGLTSNRVIGECRDFNYEGKISMLMPDSFAENRNQQEIQREWAQENRSEYIRSQYENISSMGRYKKSKVEENGSRKNMTDEYTMEQNITAKKDNPDHRRNDPKNEYNAETDHIEPLKKIFDKVQSNAGLSDGDIKDIANQDYNFAVTGHRINRHKNKMSNSEFIKKQDELKAEGKPYVELSPEVRANMIRMEKEAQKQIDKSINATLLKNLTGKGKADRAERKAAMEKRQQELGRKLTEAERQQVDDRLARQKAADIHMGNAKAAGNQSIMYAIGNVVLMILKPLYYEVRDGFSNGFKDGVNAKTYKEAFKIRFARIKNYISSQITDLKKLFGNLMDMLKNFVSALVEGLIGMFVGMFKKLFRVLKEGVKIFMEAWPVLFGKESKNMTTAQKGDAIVKILGGSAVALCGIGIDMLMDRLLLGFIELFPGLKDFAELIRCPISTLLTGTASALMFYALDRADLFNVKKDQRNQRIDEIFNERIKDIEESTRNFEAAAAETLKEQVIQFNTLMSSIKNNLTKGDMLAVDNDLLGLSRFLGFQLGYTSHEDFKEKQNNLNWDL